MTVIFRVQCSSALSSSWKNVLSALGNGEYFWVSNFPHYFLYFQSASLRPSHQSVISLKLTETRCFWGISKTGPQDSGSSNLGTTWEEVFLSRLLGQVQVIIGNSRFSIPILLNSRWFSFARLKLSFLKLIDLCFCHNPSEKQQAMILETKRILPTTAKIANSSI